MREDSFLSNVHDAQIEELYEQFCADPLSVEPSWRAFFNGFELAIERFPKSNVANGASQSMHADSYSEKEIRVLRLIDGYRARGHLFTKTNPVRQRRQYNPSLDLENFGLEASDLDSTFQAGIEVGLGPTTLRNIIDLLEETYCRSLSAEYKFMQDPESVYWLQTRMEKNRNRPSFNVEQKRRLLQKLTEAVGFERFLHTKFVGQKRFSLEGAENFIPAMDAVLRKGAELGIKEFVIGMPHRGRLNLLGNIMGKSYADIFTEFFGRGYSDTIFEGDVKYHMGFSNDIEFDGHKLHLSLSSNPSHLEAVDPVVEGIVRAKLDTRYKGDENSIAPILIHGDASIAGQGVVYEVVQMSQLAGYKTGGTIHIVINNQVGFTTNYVDGRSSIYCTDVAKVVRSPVFHVNGDDAEAVVMAVQMALEFRQKFHRDVFIDLLSYRKYGHNEGDEPRFTQPLLYKIISQHPNPLQIYTKKLLADGVITSEEAESIETEFDAKLELDLEEANKNQSSRVASYFEGDWKGLRLATAEDFHRSPNTGVNAEVLEPLAEQMFKLPEDLSYFQKTKKLFEERRERLADRNAIDWAMAEWLAYGSLLNEGVDIRISGQDVQRGTFSHRHAVITLDDEQDGKYVPLRHLSENQGGFEIYNSFLSEYAVLGFEFGYALANPRHLVIWEAQFGDFANGAQIIIDQFISSAETKWQRMNGLVMLLPHGHEGQGPEHSSARLERFLELCAGNNMQVCNCSTPANLYHMLRRQVHRPFRKPLVLMSPKSLLRHPKCVSHWDEFTSGSFHELLDDADANPKKVRRVLLCSGKIYYDLIAAREKKENIKQCADIAIIRLEQLYPWPENKIMEIVKRYKKAKEWVWVQEEAQNMGAWPFVLRKWLYTDLEVVSRKESASPSTGFIKQHESQQEYVVNTALGIWS